ncbi:AAA family ATPase [Aquihabitans sp. McL0605]|uniref:AAA family ATPase n=1 Tax=Aquihabitans sp. McL0605 TaxID=3415671 RepID=UPI003CF7ADEA
MPVDPAVLAALHAALQADPANVEVRAHLALLLLESGDAEAAWDQARTVLASQPDHVSALRTAADAGDRLGELDLAAGYRRLLAALDPAGSAPPDAARPAAEPPPVEPIAVPLTGGSAMPDTADELLAHWDRVAPISEPEIGALHRPSVTLDDVGGLDQVKARLEQSFLAPLRHPELQLQFGKSMRGGLVLWGPPGCGKTYIARAVAGELGASFYEVGLADVLDMWIGSSERNLRSVFEVARSNRPCVLFFDEVDALGHKRTQLSTSGGAMRGVVNQFLTELDGASSDNEGVFVLAATNHPWDMDPALLRPGRFDRKLLVLPPDLDARAAILATHLRGRPTEVLQLDKIAAKTDGFSGADLAMVCEQATETALAASVKAGSVRPITQADLTSAARSIRPSTGAWFDTARNFAKFSNEGGDYDELLPYLDRKRRS